MIKTSIEALISKWLSFASRTPEEVRERDFREIIKPRLKGCGWPDRFHVELSEWGEAKQKRVYEETLRRCSGCGAIVALMGVRGVGKTTITAQIAIKRAWREWENAKGSGPAILIPTIYRKLVDLVTKFKSLYSEFGSIDTEWLMGYRDDFCLYDLVVIDELLECPDQKLAYRILTDIIDRRYSERKDTILIGNTDRKGFEAAIGDSILSRLSEHGLIIECKWKNWRAQ